MCNVNGKNVSFSNDSPETNQVPISIFNGPFSTSVIQPEHPSPNRHGELHH